MPSSILPTVVSIGTTHPWNIAGIGLDLRLADRFGVRVATVIAGVSAQGGAHAASPNEPPIALSGQMIEAQWRAAAATAVAAVRIGALVDVHSVQSVARIIDGESAPVVWDPVMTTSSGERLASEATVDAMRARLMPLVDLVTPNLSEATRWCGMSVNDVAEMHAAARILVERFGARAVLVKGGHLEQRPVDVFYDGERSAEYESERVTPREHSGSASMRGTGCALAFAIAARLASGNTLDSAIRFAKRTVAELITDSVIWNGERIVR